MPVLDLTKHKIMTQNMQINKVYNNNQLVYNYEYKSYQVGNDIITQPGTTTSNVSYLPEWQSYTTYGKSGVSRVFEDGNFINNTLIGAGTNRRTNVITAATNNTYYKGTQTANTHRMHNMTVTNYSSDSTWSVKRKLTFPTTTQYPRGTRVVVTFRVTKNNGVSISGRIRYKQLNSTTFTFYNFTAELSTTNRDASGNFLYTINHVPSTVNNSHYADYIELYITQDVGTVHDVKAFVDKRSPIMYTVVSGDGWWRIQDKNKATSGSVEEIYAWNGTNQDSVIHPGERYIVGWS